MAGNGKDSRSERDSQSLVGDLLRRATSPEVLAGVAGAAAAARFTKHMVADSDEIDTDGRPEVGETDEVDEADVAGDDEPDEDEEQPDDEELDDPQAEENQPDKGEDEGEEEVPQAAAEPESDEHDEGAAPQDDGAEEAEEAEETSDSSDASNGSSGSGGDSERLELLDQARRYAEQLTGHPVESFSALEQDDRGWRIGVEVVELSRVPSTTDVLGSYELVLDSDGEFVDFRRGHRYYRNSTDGLS